MTGSIPDDAIELKEHILPDDYPVYWDYLYVADGKVIRSDIQGDVRHLKHDLGATEIKSCDIIGRQSQLERRTRIKPMAETIEPALEAALDPKALEATVVWFNENFNGLPNALALVIGIVKTYCSVASPQAEIDRLREALRNMIGRFENCARHAGNDDETVAASTAKARALIHPETPNGDRNG